VAPSVDSSPRPVPNVDCGHVACAWDAPQEFRSLFSDERPALAEIEIKMLRDDVHLYSVLNHPKAGAAFLEHQKKEFNVDNIEFWQAAEKFWRTYSNAADQENHIPPDKQVEALAQQYPLGEEQSVVKLVSELIKSGRANTVWAAKEIVSRHERRAMALHLYNLFIEEGSEKQQNISDNMRREVTRKVQRSEFPPDVFRDAQNQVYQIMQEPFHRFKKTEGFRLLLDDVGSYRKNSLWGKAKLQLDSSGRHSSVTASILEAAAGMRRTTRVDPGFSSNEAALTSGMS
jgi:hypothetical protein